MGKFDQVLEKAKADGLIRQPEPEQTAAEASPAAPEGKPVRWPASSPLPQQEERDPAGNAVRREGSEARPVPAGTRPMHGPDLRGAAELSLEDSRAVSGRVDASGEPETRLGVQGPGGGGEPAAIVAAKTDREKIAGRLDSLRGAYGKGPSGEDAKEFRAAKGKTAKHAVALLKPSSASAEYFRVIRTRILIRARERNARAILVTSSMPREGKTFLAANLAVSIANGLDQSVLLIDADFRKPSLHATFGLGETKGLSDFLAEERYDLRNLIQATSFPKLAVLPAGSCMEGSSELLTAEVMKVFMEHVRHEEEGRYILVDGPPSEISETLALSKVVDGSVVVIKAGSGDRQRVKRTVEGIGSDNILGIVLNYASSAMNNYYQYYTKAR